MLPHSAKALDAYGRRESVPSSRHVFFDSTAPRSEVTAPSHRTYPASQTFASWNQIGHVLRRLEAFRSAAGSAYGAIHISKGP